MRNFKDIDRLNDLWAQKDATDDQLKKLMGRIKKLEKRVEELEARPSVMTNGFGNGYGYGLREGCI